MESTSALPTTSSSSIPDTHPDDNLTIEQKQAAAQAFLQSSPYEQEVQQLREYYQSLGYRVHSGLQFGCELVLYADDPSRVHSDFCIRMVENEIDWRGIQSLVRSMPALHKTLVLARMTTDGIQELCFATEHAPFRHRRVVGPVGSQRKRGNPGEAAKEQEEHGDNDTNEKVDQEDEEREDEEDDIPDESDVNERGDEET